MPSYNHEKYLAESIESVLNQTIKDIELIIVDDASIDKSRTIIEDYQKRDARIKVFFHKQNEGIAKTINDAIAHTSGDYIAFTASDDVWMKHKLEKQINVLKNLDEVVVWSDGVVIDENSQFTGQYWSEMYQINKRKTDGNIFEELLKGNYICGQSRILKRKMLRDVSFDDSLLYLNDYLFEIELANKYPYYFINEPLIQYRIHGENTILNNRQMWIQDLNEINIRILTQFGDKISNRTKSHLHYSLAITYWNNIDRTQFLENIKKSVYLNPINFKLWIITLVLLLCPPNHPFIRFYKALKIRW